MTEKSVVGFFVFGTQSQKEEKMAPTANPIRPPGTRRRLKHPVRLTALLYLREALLAERYEECADLIAVAQEFGAPPYEVQLLLEDPRRRPAA